MSRMIIEDGHGTGFKAKVDEHGRQYMNAVNISHEQHHSSYHGDLFNGSFDVVLQDATETNLMFYKNTNSGKDYEFYGARVSANGDIVIKPYAERTYTSGGSTPKINNMNRGSGNVPIYEGYEGGASGDLVLGTADELEFGTIYLAANTPYTIDYKGGLILPTNHTICMTATGVAATSVNVTFLFSRHSAGYKL